MRTRIIWLILLSVTVTALPVSARPVTAAKNGPVPAAKDPKPEAPKKICVSSAVDLWDGGSTRVLTGEIKLVSIPALPGGHLDCRLAPTESWPHATAITLSLPDAMQHCWLTCRYAHAPPLIG